jgi:hypothetical protein
VNEGLVRVNEGRTVELKVGLEWGWLENVTEASSRFVNEWVGLAVSVKETVGLVKVCEWWEWEECVSVGFGTGIEVAPSRLVNEWVGLAVSVKETVGLVKVCEWWEWEECVSVGFGAGVKLNSSRLVWVGFPVWWWWDLWEKDPVGLGLEEKLSTSRLVCVATGIETEGIVNDPVGFVKDLCEWVKVGSPVGAVNDGKVPVKEKLSTSRLVCVGTGIDNEGTVNDPVGFVKDLCE